MNPRRGPHDTDGAGTRRRQTPGTEQTRLGNQLDGTKVELNDIGVKRAKTWNLRRGTAHRVSVTKIEPFFDLVCIFAVTQLSRQLSLTPA